MNFHMRCRCKPRSFVADAPRAAIAASDPTGTLQVQRRFAKDFAQRWTRVRKMIPGIINIRVDASNNIQHAALTGNNQVKAFGDWLDEAMRQLVLGINGYWTSPYIRSAGDIAIASSVKQAEPLLPPADRVPILQALAIVELQGIIDAVSQQVVRLFANGLLNNSSPAVISRQIQAIIDETGKRRSNLLVAFILVKTFSAVTLDQYRAARVASVGTIAERAGTAFPPSTVLARDAKTKSKKKKSKPKNLLEVLTAGDSRVCQICEDISDEGPYSIDDAEGLIPAHPNCRCAFVPWHDERFAHDEFIGDRNDEHEPPGSSKGGQFAKKSGSGGDDEDNLKGYSKNAKMKYGVIYTDDVNDAVLALHQNRRVELNQPKQVSTLIEKLGEVTKEMVAQGKDAPVFDLCNVTVKGTNLFCADHMGIPRIKMPQLDGKQTAAFVEHLANAGFETQEGIEPSKNLRATQNQLDGGKVARMYQRLRAEPGGRADSKRIVISRDNYILDGHHHWAGQIAVDAMDDNLGGHKTNVTRVNVSIMELYRRAMKFTGGKGAQGIGGPSHTVDAVAPWIMAMAKGAKSLWNPDLHPRDKQGQWARSGNVAGKTLYRGGTTEENPHGTYLTTDKKWAAGYGEVSSFKVDPKAKMFDLNHPKAHETWGKGWYPEGKTPSEKDRADLFRHAGLQGDDALRPEIHENIKAAGFHGIVHTAGNQTRAFMYPGHATKIEEYPDLTKISGPKFESWTPPATDVEWAHVSGQNHGIDEPPLPDLVQHFSYKDPLTGETKTHTTQGRLSSGVIMREPDGRTWLVAPTNNFGGYNWTFPKGGVEEGLHPQANAIKEVYEETGMKARITGFAGDYRGDTGTTRMYYAAREGGTPKDHGWETEAVALVHAPEAFNKLNRSRDKKIAFEHLMKKAHLGDADFIEAQHPRDDHGRWASAAAPQTKSEANKHIYDLFYKCVGGNSFTPDELKGLTKYAGDGYEGINNGLRKSGRISVAVTSIDSAVAKGKLPNDLVVYRGVGGKVSDKVFKEWDKQSGNGVIFTDKAFVSTSLRKDRAKNFSRDVMEIRVPSGSTALPLPNGGEEEILLPRGAKFRVVKVQKLITGRKIVAEYLGSNVHDAAHDALTLDSDDKSDRFRWDDGDIEFNDALIHDDEDFEAKHPRGEHTGKFVAKGTSEGDPWGLDPKMLTKVAGKMGSNEGGVFADPGTNAQYYIKFPATKDHVQNELMAAALYKLAGVNVKEFIPSKNGDAVITKFVALNKNNISQFTAAERKQAQSDFGVHAWLANWDAAGTGGDNQVIDSHGEVMTVDTGGAMKYRAQGTPKGDKYGTKVKDTESIIDPKLNPDGAKLYGPMSDQQKYESYQRVTSIPDQAIIDTVHKAGGSWEDAEKLLMRKKDLQDQENALGVKLNNAKSWESPPSAMAAEAAMAEQWDKKYPKLPEPPVTPLAASTTALLGTPKPPLPVFKTKVELASHLLKQGTTIPEMLKATGWNTISMPQTAHNANLKLEKIKGDDGVTYYKGTPMTAEEIKSKGKKPAPTYNTKATKAETDALKSGAAPSKTAAELNAEGAFDYIKPATPAYTPSTTFSGNINNDTEAKTIAKVMKSQGIKVTHTLPKPEIGIHYHSFDVSPADEDKTIAFMKTAGYKYGLDTTSSQKSTFFISTENAPYQAAPAAPKPIVKKSPDDFHADLTNAGIKHGGFETDSDNPSHYKLSAPIASAQAMAEVAKNHPEWTLKPNMKATYTAPKSAFTAGAPIVPAHDTTTNIGALKHSFDQQGIKYTQGAGNATHDFIDITEGTQAHLASQIAHGHPGVTMLNPATYTIAKAKPFVTASGNDLSTPVGAFKQALDTNGIDYEHIEGASYHHITVKGGNIFKAEQIAMNGNHPDVIPTGGGEFAAAKNKDPFAAATAASASFVDLNKPSDVFEAMLKQEGVKYGSSVDATGTLFNIMSKHDTVEEGAKYHPDAQKLGKFEYYVPHEAGPTNANAPASSLDPPHVEAFTKALKEAQLTPTTSKGTHYGTVGHFITVKKEAGSIALSNDVASNFSNVAKTSGVNEFFIADPPAAAPIKATVGKAQPAFSPPVTPAAPEPTDAELQKAKKNVALQLQYVPGAPDVPAAHALVAAFNKKYEGVVLSTDAELKQKIADFNKLKADMIPLMTVQQQQAAIVAAEKAAKQAAANAAAAATAKAEAAAAAAEQAAKLTDPVFKAHMDVLKNIGMGKYNVKQNEQMAKSYGWNVNAEQMAFIRAYIGNAYDELNSQLRSSVLDDVQYGYADALDDALGSMPIHSGYVQRGIRHKTMAEKEAIFKSYADAVGKTKIERQFTSGGKKHKLWGDITIHIEDSHSGADFSKANSEGGGEIVFKTNTPFKVTKVDKKSWTIWMTEVKKPYAKK